MKVQTTPKPKSQSSAASMVRVNDLQKSAFETNAKWIQRILAAKQIEVGYAEFCLQESNPEQGTYPVTLTVNDFCLGRCIDQIPKRIDLPLSPELAGEIYALTPKIPMSGKTIPQGEDWGIAELLLQSNGWQFDLSAEIERWEEAERQRIKEIIKKRQEKERREREEEQERERRSWIEANAGDCKTLNIKGVEYAFRWCPPGEFMMGSPAGGFLGKGGEQGRRGDETQHCVRLTKGVWMLETPVTQAMWESVMGNNPSCFKGANLPVELVIWTEASEFCKKINQFTTIGTFILPTEAQWEYACRAGTTGAYGGTGNLDDMGWYLGNSGNKSHDDFSSLNSSINLYFENCGNKTHEVKTKKPNAWGLYDMHGNVWEWCSDWYGPYPTGSVADPTGPCSGSDRVSRGGSWLNDAGYCRSAVRDYFSPEYRRANFGFRFALSLTDK